jgi:hypothetical protein
MKLPVALLQEHYSPVIPDERSYLTAAHSWKTMLIHTRLEPDRTCGYAQRRGDGNGSKSRKERKCSSTSSLITVQAISPLLR